MTRLRRAVVGAVILVLGGCSGNATPGAAGDGDAARGVPQHHWNFGTMPPQPGLDDQEIADVTAFVRRLQREADID